MQIPVFNPSQPQRRRRICPSGIHDVTEFGWRSLSSQGSWTDEISSMKSFKHEISLIPLAKLQYEGFSAGPGVEEPILLSWDKSRKRLLQSVHKVH